MAAQASRAEGKVRGVTAQTSRAAAMALSIKRACPLETPARYNAAMRRRGRMFKATKWAMTLGSVALLALFVASGWWTFYVHVPTAKRIHCMVAGNGRVAYTLENYSAISWENPTQLEATIFESEGCASQGPYFAFRRTFEAARMTGPNIVWGFNLSLQLIAMSAVLAVVMWWWLDRKKHPPGHCPHCGYDLTGNESGICPECGKPNAKCEMQNAK